MSKRFFDTSLFDKRWFRELSVENKCAFMFLLAKCDNVGVWDVDKKAAEFKVGQVIDWDSLLKECNGNIRILNSDKWWIVDFIRFQHPDLFSGSLSNACKSYIALLKRHGIYKEFPELFEAYGKPSQRLGEAPKEKEGVKEKEQVKVRVKEKEEKRPIYHLIENAFLSQSEDYDFKREGPHVVAIEKKALARPDPEEFVKKIIVVFWRLVNSKDKFWREQPFLPSLLNSGGVWPRVLKKMQQMEGQKIDAETRQFLEDLF